MRVEEVMSHEVTTVGPDTSLKEAARLLAGRRVSGMPVVDGDGAVVGVISEADVLVKERAQPREHASMLARLLQRPDPQEEEKLEARLVGEAMTSPAITIEPFWSVSAAAERMLDEEVNRLPVVSLDGRLLGIVTRADIVRAFARKDADIEREIREQLELQQALAGDRQPLDVRIAAGEVTLKGRVRRRMDAEALPQVIARVTGVVGVRSEIDWDEDL
ncbi:MAG: CBS domain-containing protein [Solirubrobacteraceae bacterium]|nr:CBS domain-containing protein [Solirubrobacteraceae bacterium]